MSNTNYSKALIDIVCHFSLIIQIVSCYTQCYAAVVTVLESFPPRTIVFATDEVAGAIRVTVAVAFLLPARIFFRATAVPAVALVRATIDHQEIEMETNQDYKLRIAEKEVDVVDTFINKQK